MELREPRRKRRVQVKPRRPFPIPIDSFTEEPVFNGVWRIYTGQYAGNNVVVNNPEDMTALHNMGCFGKGSLSRSGPSFGKWKMDTPPLIYNRQWKRRREWAEKCRKNLTHDHSLDSASANTGSNENVSVVKVEKPDESEENLSRNGTKKQNSDSQQVVETVNSKITTESNIKHELVELDDDDDDDVVMIECIVKNDEARSSGEERLNNTGQEQAIVSDRMSIDHQEEVVTFETDNASKKSKPNEQRAEAETKEGQTVIVLADSDCDSDNEEYLLHIAPRLEQEQFPIQETLQLTLEEAFFLSYGLGCFKVLDLSEKELSLLEMWGLFCQSQEDFVQKYVVYHYFRSKGWVVKPGMKFGGDFLLYKQGPSFYHASYVVVIKVVSATGIYDHEHDHALSWTRFIGLNRLSETSGKEIMLCHVVWPADVPREGFIKSPKVLEKFTVQEVLMRRWVSSQEREELEDEEQME